MALDLSSGKRFLVSNDLSRGMSSNACEQSTLSPSPAPIELIGGCAANVQWRPIASTMATHRPVSKSNLNRRCPSRSVFPLPDKDCRGANNSMISTLLGESTYSRPTLPTSMLRSRLQAAISNKSFPISLSKPTRLSRVRVQT